MRVDEAVADRQAEARALRLRGEERLEETAAHGVVDAGAGVGHADLHAPSLGVRHRFERAAARHRLDGVQQ